ncbi:MAG: DUF4296 domain-containing protein [Bacteroidota bacterium]
MTKSPTYLAVLLSLLMGLSLQSCGDESRPDSLMSETEMVPVLKDLQIAYAGVDQTVRNPKQRPRKYQEMNELIMEKHGINKDLFFESYVWYQEHPALMDSLYQEVITALNIDMVPLQNKQRSKAKPKGKDDKGKPKPKPTPKAGVKGK